MIVANTALLVAGMAGLGGEVVEHAEMGCLVFFAGELVVRLHRCRWRPHVFARQGWNVVDAVIVGLSLLPVLGAGVTVLRVGAAGAGRASGASCAAPAAGAAVLRSSSAKKTLGHCVRGFSLGAARAVQVDARFADSAFMMICTRTPRASA
jgi:hypothetical protein